MRIGGFVALAMLLASCGSSPEGQETDNASANKAAADQTAPAQADHQADPAEFDIEKVAVSNAALGEFPYIRLPDGYEWQRSQTREFDHFMFWTGTAFRDVEGKFYEGKIVAGEGKEYSEYELKRNLEAILSQSGAAKVVEARIPRDELKKLPDDITTNKVDGLSDVYNNPATIWVIRREDRQIWIHWAPSGYGAGLAMIETKPFVATAGLLPAAELKQSIDRTGKATVHVNFATDASDILPDSRPQIDAITTVLEGDPTLRLAINGHTDDTGDAARNRSLSERRAASVKRALVDAGVAADRLTTKGFGSTVPIAGNDSAEGKARNRRVELVRL